MFTFLPSGLTPSIRFLSTIRKVSRSALKVSSEHNQNANPHPVSFRKQLPMKRSCLQQVSCFLCKTRHTEHNCPRFILICKCLLRLLPAFIWGISCMLNVKRKHLSTRPSPRGEQLLAQQLLSPPHRPCTPYRQQKITQQHEKTAAPSVLRTPT